MNRGNYILRWAVFLAAILCAGGLSRWMRGAGPAAVPSVNVGGVVNNASYTLASRNIAPGTIVAVFGTDLTDGSSCLAAAGCFPSFDSAGRLGTSMSGTQVIVNGIPVPIFYAAPTQLGIQIPTDLPGTSASIRVTVGSQTSEPRSISLDPFSPGIFTVSQDGKGAGAITHSDGSLVDTSNPAQPGETIIIYATGLGQVTPPLATGALPRDTTTTLTTPTVTIDGIPAQVQFSGLSGCCVGLNQINAMVPINVHLASNISVVLSIGGRQSNVVTLATAATTPLTAAPGSINFGDVQVGTSSTRTVTLTNTGIGSLTISQANVSGPGFTVSGLSLPMALGAGQSTSFSVTFLPTVPGSVAGSVSITSDVLNSFLVPLSGNATSTTTSQPTITANALPDGSQNTPYNATLAATGGQTPYSWSINAGSLPAGLTLAASTGVISGTPTSTGTSNFTVRVTDANSQTATKSLSITISSPNAPLITTASLPDGTQNVLYNASVQATGGSAPYSWSVSAGSLPAGLALAASTGVISGTPTSTGTSNFTVRVTDANSQTATKSLSITINSPNVLLITTASLPDGTQNVLYNTSVQATGGSTPYSWSVSAGTLPAGLTLAASTGVISGTPTSVGTSNFTVQVTDANSQTATKALSITVSASTSTPPSVSLTWTASASVVVGYNIYRGNASGGPYTKINSVLIPTCTTPCTYVDTTIVRGLTYFYVATAVDSLGVESLLSNEATTVVP